MKPLQPGKRLPDFPHSQTFPAMNGIAPKNNQNLMYDAFADAFSRTRNRSWPDIEETLAILRNDSRFSLGNVLDIGCGSGRLAGILEDYEGYLGIDVSEELLRIAREKFPHLTFSRYDMREASKCSSTTFDTVFLIASFHHILAPDAQAEVLSQIKDLLSKSGTAVLLNWNLRSERNRKRYSGNWVSETVLDIPFSGHSRHYYAFALDELENLFSQV